MEGQTDRGKTVYPPPPSGSGGINVQQSGGINIQQTSKSII